MEQKLKKETGLTGQGISYSEKGNISELGLLPADLFIMGQEGDRYIAVRDGDVISFTSSIPL